MPLCHFHPKWRCSSDGFHDSFQFNIRATISVNRESAILSSHHPCSTSIKKPKPLTPLTNENKNQEIHHSDVKPVKPVWQSLDCGITAVLNILRAGHDLVCVPQWQ